DLARMEGQAPERPEPAARTPSPARTERSGGVLEQLHLGREHAPERLPVERPAEEMDGDDRLRSGRRRLTRLRRVEVHRLGVDVDEHRARGAAVRHRGADPANAGWRALYQAIVRARPSSSSTCASKPRISRAFSTFGTRSSTSA